MPTEINIQLKCCNINGTYAELLALHNSSTAVCGQAYTMTDHSEIYFQPISGDLKTATVEPIILMGNSSGKFDFVVRSTLHPTDVIHYDITVDTVTDGVTTEPAKGRIIYRKDENGNESGFDWRNILAYNTITTTESLLFDLSNNVVENRINWNLNLVNIIGINLPNSAISGDSYLNYDVILLISFVNNFISNSNSNFTEVITNENVTRNINCRFEGVKCGLNENSNLFLELIDTNSLKRISLCSGVNANYGISNSTIEGVSPTSEFIYNTFECILEGKTIEEDSGSPTTSYPELFNAGIHCIVFENQNGEYYYRYYNTSNTLIIKQIL
jgi:hypothetical protein